MMKRRIAFALTPISLCAFALPAHATDPGDASFSSAEEFNVLADAGELARTSEEDDALAAIAPFLTGVDNPHISHSSAKKAVHVHGWWITSHKDLVGRRAKVTVQMQSYTDAAGWFNVGSFASGTHYQGGGAGKRTTGHFECKNNALAHWRAYVDVDIIGVWDTPGKRFSKEVELHCGH